ncbi:hypothetical protein ABXN37_15535 [Piscinibacter sakaiensis]|uniref:DUF4124 domain-containing protein n=1 Tax=Piscinibacter sakaiensis TaxID=1547922 RepID=A0A0K8P1P6_PISS1|nr:hypothetical protein [Piscinibacter sakaiensis]GAP36556.1 hypothetical protein ISF6_2396 [Piscinibacter sakaiensis]
MPRTRLILAAAALLAAVSVSAQPSLYYKWQHKSTRVVACEPDAPGKEWTRIAGPYSDPDCKMPEPQ